MTTSAEHLRQEYSNTHKDVKRNNIKVDKRMLTIFDLIGRKNE